MNLRTIKIETLRNLNVRALTTCDCFEHVIDPKTFYENMARIFPSGARVYFRSGEIAQDKGQLMMPHINCPSQRTLDLLGKDTFTLIRRCGINETARILERI